MKNNHELLNYSNKEIEEKEQKKYKLDYESDVKFEGEYLSKILLNTDGHIEKYSETLQLNSDGTIVVNDTGALSNAGRTILERARRLKEINESNLREYLNDIVNKFPNLKYSIDIDKESNQMTVKVESKIRRNALAQWISQGAKQFSEPKKIKHIDIKESIQYAFFDETTSGIPVSQLEIIE